MRVLRIIDYMAIDITRKEDEARRQDEERKLADKAGIFDWIYGDKRFRYI